MIRVARQAMRPVRVRSCTRARTAGGLVGAFLDWNADKFGNRRRVGPVVGRFVGLFAGGDLRLLPVELRLIRLDDRLNLVAARGPAAFA